MNADWKLVKLREILLCIGILLLAGAVGAVCGKALTTPSDNRSQETVSVPAPQQESLSGWFNSEWKSVEEIEGRVAGLSEEQLRAMLQRSDGHFWRGHPNASETFRAAVEKLAENAPHLALLADCAAWLDGWQLPDASRRRLWREAVGVICSRTEVDLTALASLVRGRSEEDIYATLEAFLEARPAASLEGALTQAQQFIAAAGLKDDDAQRSRAKALVTTAWLIRAPEEALRLAAATDRMAIREALHEPLRRMRALDPKGAGRLLGLASELLVYPEAIGETAFIAGFTPGEIRDAFADAPQKTRLRYLDIYAARADEMAPEQLVTMASLFPADELVPEASGNGLSQYGTNAVIRAMAERDPAGCERWLAPLEANVREDVLGNVMNFPALFDAPFARFYLDRAAGGSAVYTEPYEVRRALRAITEENPELALSYLDRLSADHRVDAEKEIRTSQIAALMSENPKDAMAMAESAPESLRQELLGFSVAERFGYDPEGAAEWMKSVQDPDLRKFLEIHLIMRRAVDPEMSGEERYDRLTSLGASQKQIGWAVTEQVLASARVDPEEAGTSILRQPDASSNGGLVELLMSDWVVHDPANAAAWASMLPPGISLDVAANQLIEGIPDQPEDALSWASVIGDREHRFIVVEALVKRWAMADLRTAEGLVASAPLAAEERNALLRMLAETPQARRKANGL